MVLSSQVGIRNRDFTEIGAGQNVVNSSVALVMLDTVAYKNEMQVENAVASISWLIEPPIMSIVVPLLAGIMITMYFPIFMLGSVM